ncbi:hypothetical protein ACFL60_06220, partial [Candidatus Omnitrophota bacterium]
QGLLQYSKLWGHETNRRAVKRKMSEGQEGGLTQSIQNSSDDTYRLKGTEHEMSSMWIEQSWLNSNV